MAGTPSQTEVLDRLVAWGGSSEDVRAIVLTSTRARHDASADELSDYDVILAVRDPSTFLANDDWTSAYGRALASWGDEHELYGSTATFRGVVYADGVKIDYTVWPGRLLEHVAEADTLPDDLDVGYRVLLDKDGVTRRWAPPTYRAHIPAKPARAEFDALIEEFWWDSTYVAKALWRGEVVFAKFVLEHDMKNVALRRMLEWRVELDHDWSLRPGAYGRGLERLLPGDIAAELARTYVGSEVDDNWEALFRTTALFRRVATEVGDAFGFPYARETDDGVTAQLEAVRRLPPKSS